MLNCAHGKDRTGIVTALVLSCVGLDKESIATDYAASEVGEGWCYFALVKVLK
jgi:protein-tyrosine phosphatase